MRHNRDGRLLVPFGRVAQRSFERVEKSTIFHLLPGAMALTFGTCGRDRRCPPLTEPRRARGRGSQEGAEADESQRVTAMGLVDEAVGAGARVVCAAYDEPMLAAEWAKAVFRAAHARGLRTAVVSDGHSTEEALRYLREDADVLRVDLNAPVDAIQRQLGGRTQPILDSIAKARELGYWVEVVTRMKPTAAPELGPLLRLGGQIREIGRNIPWHLASAPAGSSTVESDRSSFLVTAARAAYAAGHRFVYVSEGRACAPLLQTRCPDCQRLLVARGAPANVESDLLRGACPGCCAPVPGVWA